MKGNLTLKSLLSFEWLPSSQTLHQIKLNNRQYIQAADLSLSSHSNPFRLFPILPSHSQTDRKKKIKKPPVKEERDTVRDQGWPTVDLFFFFHKNPEARRKGKTMSNRTKNKGWSCSLHGIKRIKKSQRLPPISVNIVFATIRLR